MDLSLVKSGELLVKVSKDLLDLYKQAGDQRMLRAELMLSELGEMVIAMGKRDEIEVLDGIADLLYVVYGTATTFDLPAEEAFDEVHRSNMTKNSGAATHGAEDATCGKGKEFSKPDLDLVLSDHRAKKGK